MPIDFDAIRAIRQSANRYSAQLKRLKDKGQDTTCIEKTVTKAVQNLTDGQTKSFVIFGEPQSGKTEMMICLTARLIDIGSNLVIHLLNDSVQLLDQNLNRFKRSGLPPAARNFSEVMEPDISLKTGQHIVFAKKNAKDLEKLLDKTRAIRKKIIIDDEADFATPNAKINKGEVTRINGLIRDLIGDDGAYIGVTATPARLDLNNTLNNSNEKWVRFEPHPLYTGQNEFFPLGESVSYRLNLLGDTYDGPKFAREALFRFLVTVAYLNLFENKLETNYSMLVHTSGKTDDHSVDRKVIEDANKALIDPGSPHFEPYMRHIGDIAEQLYPNTNHQKIVEYVSLNAARMQIVVMNSARDKNIDFSSATNPATLFTIAIGGNIVSRGVTFDNLLSMYFTRTTKTKLQQDTYIQRARMFGSRGSYLKHFELTIPESLYQEWHRCFIFHKLALASIEDGKGSPIWLADNRIAAVSASSIDRARVQFDRGEMSFAMFDFTQALDEITEKEDITPLQRLEQIRFAIGDAALPEYLLKYVDQVSPDGIASIAVHRSMVPNYKDADYEKIERTRGFIGTNQLEKTKFPQALHHFRIVRNDAGKARMFYKFEGSIQFIKNLRK
jgi:hypothetical protein